MNTKSNFCFKCKTTVCSTSEHEKFRMSSFKGKWRFPNKSKKSRRQFKKWWLSTFILKDEYLYLKSYIEKL